MDAESFKKGSARIALEVTPPFRKYVFIERSATRVADLQALRDEFPGKNVQIEHAELPPPGRAHLAILRIAALRGIHRKHFFGL